MASLLYRIAEPPDIPALARLRAAEWGDEPFWIPRIAACLSGEHSPRYALAPRAIYVAIESDSIVGFIAGHLTRRFSCEGELQWVNVDRQHRSRGIASALLNQLAQWFCQQGAFRICVDVDPADTTARRYYTRNGAQPLNPHWLVFTDIRAPLAPNARQNTKKPS